MDTISVLLISAVGVCLVAIIGMLIWSWRHRPTEAERQAARMAALDRVISDEIPQRPPYPQGVQYPPFEGPPLQYPPPQYGSPGWQQGPPARPQGIQFGHTEYVMPSNVVIEEPTVIIEEPAVVIDPGPAPDMGSCTSVAADGTENHRAMLRLPNQRREFRFGQLRYAHRGGRNLVGSIYLGVA